MTQGIAVARAHETQWGMLALSQHPIADNGVPQLAVLAAIVLLANGLVFCAMGLRGRRTDASVV